MDLDINAILIEHFPSALHWVALLIIIYLVVKYSVLTFDSVAKAAGPVGKWFRKRRTITQAESGILRQQFVDLENVVKTLQYRDACYFAFVLKDQEWHQNFEMLALAHGWKEIPPHQSYLEFRKKWVTDRGLEKELELWN